MPQGELRELDSYQMEPFGERSAERQDAPYGGTLIAQEMDAAYTADWESMKLPAKHEQPGLEPKRPDRPSARQVFPVYLFRIGADDRISDALRDSTSPFPLPVPARRGATWTNLDAGLTDAFWDAVDVVRRTGTAGRIEHTVRTRTETVLYEIWIAPTPTNDLVGIACDMTGSLYRASGVRAGEGAAERVIANLWQEKHRLEVERDQLLSLATHDSLTGIWNRRAILELLAKALAGTLREIRPVTVLMADIDRFKRVNDRFGHQIGDAVLRETARRFRLCVRRSDEVGRYGGEEFLIVLPGCGAAAAISRAEEFRAAISGKPFQTAGRHLPVTCSLGLYSIFGSGYDCEEVIRKADTALYQAKRSGRNRVEIAG